jgi:hypothetical protein
MFNFARRQQTIVTRAGESLSAETKDFDDILSAESVIILSEKFKEFGGAPEKLLPMLQKSPMPGLAVSPGGKP